MKKLFLSICFLITGCASTHQIVANSMQKTVAAQNNDIHFLDGLVKLPTNATAYMAYPNNGYDDLHSYPESAKETLLVLNDALKNHFKKLTLASHFQSAQFEYLAARSQKYDYFILPRIVKWTESYTLLTGVADQVKLSIKIYDLRTNQLIDEIHIKSTSSKMPGFEKKPIELLHEPLAAIAKNLFMQGKSSNV
ncbi:DUF4823 domain-containing protein [Cysteiniphilum halobium]|uniref:DUF4823 domain-containing protein n=1 Tax=Cysteiniphilum halobium TaxID=2219059 RepID=UPI000E64868E|nr:DUF4823 domain-containing protein [Cysteiniphilum halobium]